MQCNSLRIGPHCMLSQSRPQRVKCRCCIKLKVSKIQSVISFLSFSLKKWYMNCSLIVWGQITFRFWIKWWKWDYPLNFINLQRWKCMSNFLQHIAIMEAPHDTYVIFSIIFDFSYSKIILPHSEQNHMQI